jgi:NAD(P)-dependent dehydrogenase (short-subunit alcohol dehydrogenase family)
MNKRWQDLAPDPEAARQEFSTMMPIRRFGRPEEVAGAILFFASDDSSLCQGAILPVDGGYVAQ